MRTRRRAKTTERRPPAHPCGQVCVFDLLAFRRAVSMLAGEDILKGRRKLYVQLHPGNVEAARASGLPVVRRVPKGAAVMPIPMFDDRSAADTSASAVELEKWVKRNSRAIAREIKDRLRGRTR